METHIQATEDALLDSLSFKLPNSANFISDRRSVTFFPSGGNQYSPNGVKIIKFMITGTDWLDPSSVRVSFRLNNSDETNPLYLVNALPANFFRRLRILCGGAVIEDIDFYNRVYNMVNTLLPYERRLNDATEGFGTEPFNEQNTPFDKTYLGNTALNNCPGLFANSSRVVLFPLLCGIFNQPKFLPLRYLQGLQIELEVVNNFTDPILSRRGSHVPQDLIPVMSTTWYIDQPVVKCDVVSLDGQLDNEYTDHLMQGKTLPINYSSFVHQIQAIGNTDRPVISMNRAFTRLKTVYCTFFKIPYVWAPTELIGDQNPAGYSKTQHVASDIPLNETNLFWHPQYIYQVFNSDNGTGNAILNYGTTNLQSNRPILAQQQGFVFQKNCEVEMQLQVGSKLIPEIPIRTSAEAYYHLRKALGSHQPGSHYAVNIPEREYRTSKFIVAFDCERQTNTGFSGLNTRTGDLITIKINNLKHTDNRNITWNDSFADFLHTTLEYDAIMTISDAGVQVLE